MRDLRGIVVDIQEDRGTVIVLTPECDVREVFTNGQKFMLGDEILFYEEVIEPQKESQWGRRAIKYVAVAAAASALFFCVDPLQVEDSHLAYTAETKHTKLGNPIIPDTFADSSSSVYIESKPNLKIKVKDQKVVSVDALNQPAKNVLKEMHWSKNENIDKFMQNYFEKAKKAGYINPKQPVVISVDTEPDLESKKEALLKKIETISKKIQIKAVPVAVPDEVVKEANALGVTPGKLAISLVAKASTGKTIPLDKLKTATVSELVNTVPNVVETLPRFTEEQLAQLVQKVSVVSTTTDSQSTKTANTENQPTSKESSNTEASTTTTENKTTDVGNNTKATDKTAADSTMNQSKSVDSDCGSNSSEQPQKQPESQPQEKSDPSTVNNGQQSEPQKQVEGQPQEGQKQQVEGQPQEGQKQEDQKQEDQAPKQAQEGKQQQDDQAHDDQAQQGEQKQNEQHKDGQDNQPQKKNNSPVATIIEWVKDVLNIG